MLRGLKLRSAAAALSRRSYRRPYATAITDLSRYPKPGDNLHGFTLQRAQHVPELELSALELVHDKTGAQYLHIAREDKNNVFSIGFKTNPSDDTGVPHILEHTTLCGSEKYPVRDPFFKMLTRSLSNFMNAFTSSDHTFYPFATTNAVDFGNLMDVYLDATLHPLLKETDFRQEGWRIGPENPLQEGSPLVFKGVVFNEMKGQMSDSGYLFYIRFRDHIFPSIHNSGGDPLKIPDLTLEQLRNFHQTNYHPSNSKILTYGNFPLESNLAKINDRLSKFDRIAAEGENKFPISINKPLKVTVSGPLDPMAEKDQQYKTSISWILCDTGDVFESFSLMVLSNVLLDGYGSPFYQSLIESKLGADFAPNTGYDSSSRKSVFSVGLQNVSEDNLSAVEEAIHATLKKVHAEGIDPRKVEGILHQLELALKHKTANFGMSLMHRLKPSWFNGVDPFESLAWNALVNRFKEECAKGRYLEGLIEKYLMNDRTLTFTMAPSPKYEQTLAAEEAKTLESKIQEAGGWEKAEESLRKQELELVEVQELAQQEDLSSLPTLHVSDIPRQLERKELSHSVVGDTQVQWRTSATNGLTYFRALNVFDDLPENLRLYLPLYTEAIFRLGTSKMNMEQIEDEIKLKTGGLSASYFANTNPADLDKCTEGLGFSGYCLDKNVPRMFEIFKMLLLETSFSRVSKLRTLVQGLASGSINSIADSGHQFAKTFASASLTPASRKGEATSGLTQLKLINDLAQSENYFPAIQNLKAIAEFAASKASLRTAFVCGEEARTENEKALSNYLTDLPTTRPKSSDTEPFVPSIKDTMAFFPLPFQVNYAAMCFKTAPYTSKDGATLQILSKLLSHKHLHHEIREKGGAYGGGAFHGGVNGIFGYYSYRDPNPLNTLKIMNEAGKVAAEKTWSDEEIEQAKLSVFQGVDAPVSVSQEGMLNFFDRLSDDMRQARRENLLDVTAADIKDVAQRYLADRKSGSATSTAVLGANKDWATSDNGWDIYNMGNEPIDKQENFITTL